MRGVSAAIALSLAPAANAKSGFAQGVDGTYYCTEEESGGLLFDKTQKRWRGASFRTDDKFNLGMNFVERKHSDVPGLEYSYYEVEDYESGEKRPGYLL